MPHPWSDYQDWQGQRLREDPHKGVALPWLKEGRPCIRRWLADADMADEPPTVEMLVELNIQKARELAYDYADLYADVGIDQDDAESEAMLALARAAKTHVGRGLSCRTFWKYARYNITKQLDRYGSTYRYRLVAMTDRAGKAIAKVQEAIECLANRGIDHPTVGQIAGESLLGEDVVEEALKIPTVLPDPVVHEFADPYGFSLVPLFGPQPGFSPQTACADTLAHPIAKGSRRCCMVCNESGMDHHRAMRRNPETDPKPERPNHRADKDSPPPIADRIRPETRAQRRQRLFGPKQV